MVRVIANATPNYCGKILSLIIICLRIESFVENTYELRSALSLLGWTSKNSLLYDHEPNLSSQLWSSNGKKVMSITQELVIITGFNQDTFPSCFTTRRAAVLRPSEIASALKNREGLGSIHSRAPSLIIVFFKMKQFLDSFQKADSFSITTCNHKCRDGKLSFANGHLGRSFGELEHLYFRV